MNDGRRIFVRNSSRISARTTDAEKLTLIPNANQSFALSNVTREPQVLWEVARPTGASTELQVQA
jgi:hypothetical protein